MQDIIKASREKNQEQLRKEGKGLGMFMNEPNRNSKSQQQPHQQKTQEKKKKQDYEEVFDHLEEPDFDEEEMLKTAELLRARQQSSLAAR